MVQDYPEYREYEAFDPGVDEEELEEELEGIDGETQQQLTLLTGYAILEGYEIN